MTLHRKHSVNSVNYIAITILEQIGIDSPSQNQIDIVETLILLGTSPRLMNLDAIEKCLGDDNTAKHIFRRFLKLSPNQELLSSFAS